MDRSQRGSSRAPVLSSIQEIGPHCSNDAKAAGLNGSHHSPTASTVADVVPLPNAADIERQGKPQRPGFKWPWVPFYSDIGKGSWQEGAYHLCTMTATPAAYATLPFAFSRLTWAGGLPLLLITILLTYYNAMLTAGLHQWNVVVRHCRWRDLAKSLWGMPGFYTTFILQQMGSLGNNFGIQLASAFAMKDIYNNLRGPEGNLTLQQWLTLFGAAQLILSQAPTLHSLKKLNMLGTVLSAAFTILITVECFRLGRKLPRDEISYQLPAQTMRDKIFGVFQGFGLISFSLCNILLPEIQATVRPPAVANGYKGVTAASVGVGVGYVLVAVAGYWAFGSSVNQVVVLSFTQAGLLRWPGIAAEVLLVIHGVINYQVFARSSFECFEYLLMDDRDGNMLSFRNCIARLGSSACYIATITFLTALFPTAFDDFAALAGALCFVPLDLIFPMLLHDKARKSGRLKRTIHMLLAAFWVALALASAIGAFYSLVTQAGGLQLFANV